MNKKLFFEIDEHEILENPLDSHFATARILAFSSGKNRHGYFCSEETLRNTSQTLDYKPVVYLIDELFLDFGTHSKIPEKSLIAGFVIPNSQEFETLPDGRLGLYVNAKIWKKYSGRFMNFMKRDGGKKSVSVEMDLYESSPSLQYPNIEDMNDFEYNAVCILGDNVTPASPDASIEMISFAEEQKEYEKLYRIEFGKYEGLDFTIPKKVKENAKNGLELRKKYGRGSTGVGVSTAKYLISNQKASPEKVRHISKYFPRHENDNLDDKTSNGWISWLIWGGSAGRSWSTKLVKEMDKIDSSNMSFFSEGVEKEENLEMKNEKPEEEKKEEEVVIENATPESEEEKKESDFSEESDEDKSEGDDENTEESEDEKEEESEEENMSLDAYTDVPAMLSLLESETEEYKELSRKFNDEKSVDWRIFAKALFEKAKNIKEEAEGKEKAYMSENEELKKFKSDIEEKQYSFEVGKIFAQVQSILPKDKFEEVKEDAKNFSLESLDAFKNKTLALAFQYSKTEKKNEKDSEFVAYQFPVSGETKHESPWG